MDGSIILDKMVLIAQIHESGDNLALCCINAIILLAKSHNGVNTYNLPVHRINSLLALNRELLSYLFQPTYEHKSHLEFWAWQSLKMKIY